jgi:branched-chain amino acid transport system substrate-binding protein
MSVFAKATASRSARAAWTGVALAGVSALLLTACSSGTPAPAESEEPAAESDCAQPIAEGERDLTLNIGTILPQSGTLAFLGPPEEAGVQLGADDVNAVDSGLAVEITYRDSGDTTTDIATVSVTDLLSQDVSAIIGAASSGVSKTVIDQIVAAGVIQFSPANTSADFTDYDDNGLYWRTSPSDVLQGEVLGNRIASDGNSTLGLIVLNDAYGTGLAEYTKAAFEAAGGEVVAEALFNEGDSSFDSQIADVTAANPDAIALITFDQSKIIVPALVGGGYPGDKLYFVDGNLSDYSKDFDKGTLEGAYGTQPGSFAKDDFKERLAEVDDSLEVWNYAGESYDAANLVALASVAAGSTDGKAIAEKLQEVSVEGEKCTDFASCKTLLDAGTDIDYDGISGPISFSEKGDVSEGIMGIYQYDEKNVPQPSKEEAGAV